MKINKSIAVVTDSTADIPPELAENHNIRVVPAILVIDGKSTEDGTGISRHDFYTQMPTMRTLPTTATPSIGTFQLVYEELLQEGFQKVISIHVSSLLSGIVSTAQTAARTFKDRVDVIDSGQLSLGLGFQVLAAAEAAAKGYPLDRIIQSSNHVRQRVRVIAMLDTLEYVRRSGRVSWAKARIGSLLQIKPFLEVKEGKVLNLGQVRTRNKGMERLLSLYKKFGKLHKLAILHTNAEVDANYLLAQVKNSIPKPPLIVNVTTIVGTHVGPNALGFAAVLA